MEIRSQIKVQGQISPVVIAEGWRAALPKMLRLIRDRAELSLGSRVRSRRGRLRASLWEHIEQGGKDLPTGRVGASHFTGAILEGGARPHLIEAGSDYRLKFRIGRRWLSPRRVRHPGLRPRRWLATAVEESRAELEQVLGADIAAALGRAVAGRLR
jgi:hypothetical protein